MNKKLIGLFVAMIMLMSMLPAIMADGIDSVNIVDSVDDNDDSMSDIDADMLEVAAKEPTVESCIQRLKKDFPKVDPVRIKQKCDIVLRVAKNQDIKPVTAAKMVRTRAVYQERLDKLDDQYRDHVEKLTSEQIRKMTQLKQEDFERVARLGVDQLEKLAKLDRSRLKVYAELSEKELKAKLDNLRVSRVKKEDAFRERVVSEKKLEAAENRYNKAVDKYNNAKSEFNKEKQAWQRAIEAEDNDAAIDHAKNYLGHAADMIIESLEKVISRVEGSDDLTEDEVTTALVDLEEKIAKMKSLKDDLDAAVTKEDVKEAGKAIVASWNLTRYKLQVHAENVVRNNIGEVLSRSSALEAHLDRVISDMEEDGIVIDDLDEKLNKFSELIASARDKFKKADELFKDAKDNNDEDAFDASKSLVREAHNELKDAHTLLKDIVKEIKGQGYNVEDDDEYVEVIEEDGDTFEDGNESDDGSDDNDTEADDNATTTE